MPAPKSKKAPVKKAKGTSTPAKVESRPEHYVYMEKSMTKNLGDYNSTRISVGLTVQVDPTPEELKALKKTVSIVNDVLDAEIEEQAKAFE